MKQMGPHLLCIRNKNSVTFFLTLLQMKSTSFFKFKKTIDKTVKVMESQQDQPLAHADNSADTTTVHVQLPTLVYGLR